MKEPIIFRRADVLAPEEALYWKDRLYRATMIGTEIEVALPKGVRKDDFLPTVVDSLHPTGSLGDLGSFGVLDVQSEHCGLEVRVIGRPPYFPALVKQFSHILGVLRSRSARARPTCGVHFHLLVPLKGEIVPEIILANVWNLTRRHATALRFLSSGGDRSDALCRRRNYASHLEMVRQSPALLRMHQIQSQLKESKVVPEHNNFLNLEHVVFNRAGAIETLHYEYRFFDVDLTPTGLAAKACLTLALLLKAVEHSQYGVIHVGRLREWRRKEQLLDMLSNNDGALATSDTSLVTPDVVEELRALSSELLMPLKPAFGRMNCDAAYQVLVALGNDPISLRRTAGHDWAAIEANLSTLARIAPEDLEAVDKHLVRRIELVELSGQASRAIWQESTARLLGLETSDLEFRLQRLHAWRGLRWDPQVGAMSFIT